MLTNEKLIEMLQEAARIGIKVGDDEIVTGEYTAAGIAMTVYLDYLKENPTPTPPVQHFRKAGDL